MTIWYLLETVMVVMLRNVRRARFVRNAFYFFRARFTFAR
jgi:hypothetical protein